MLLVKTKIGPSKIAGTGLFAAEPIAAGQALGEFEGVPMSFEEFEQLHDTGDTRISCDHLQVGTRAYIKISEPYVLINHSCEPNMGLRGERTMVALRDIAPGEEITYDYSTTEWTVQEYPPYYTDGWPMACHCGAASCRGKIGCFPYLPEDVKEKYLKSGVIQDYILERLKEPAETARCFICEKYLQLA